MPRLRYTALSIIDHHEAAVGKVSSGGFRQNCAEGFRFERIPRKASVIPKSPVIRQLSPREDQRPDFHSLDYAGRAQSWRIRVKCDSRVLAGGNAYDGTFQMIPVSRSSWRMSLKILFTVSDVNCG